MILRKSKNLSQLNAVDSLLTVCLTIVAVIAVVTNSGMIKGVSASVFQGGRTGGSQGTESVKEDGGYDWNEDGGDSFLSGEDITEAVVEDGYYSETGGAEESETVALNETAAYAGTAGEMGISYVQSAQESQEEGDAGYGYIIEGSDCRYITADEISDMSAHELRLARNEIYARLGRMFHSEDLNSYFNSMDWYSPSIPADQFDESILNEYEKANLDVIKSVEATK